MKYVEITYRYEDRPPHLHASPVDAAAARARLDDGKRAFASLLASLGRDDAEARRVIPVDPRELGLLSGDASTPKQRPYAAVVGCSDARVPVELIFNEGPNDLFVVRVAGNTLGDDVLASLRYAVDHLDESIKLIDSREVWASRAGRSMCAGLAEPPRDAAQFSRFGDEVVRSQRIVAMLERRAGFARRAGRHHLQKRQGRLATPWHRRNLARSRFDVLRLRRPCGTFGGHVS